MLRRYLLEIGMEEFPAGYVAQTKNQVIRTMEAMLNEEEIPFEKVSIDCTPRRFAILISGLPENTREKKMERRGPSRKIAFDEEGNPTKALEGFLRGQDATLEDVAIREIKGEDYVFVSKKLPGKSVEEILKNRVPEVIRSWTFPKSMRWGGKNFRFARPVRWILSLMEDKILPFELEGIPVGNQTNGHRFLGKNPVTVPSVDDYEKLLEENYVIVNEEKRRDMILTQSRKLVRGIGGELLFDEDLLDEIVHIVEYPTALLGNIQPEYLELPKEVIITPMKDHQRYFPVVDGKGNLAPYFVTVRNGGTKGLDTVRKGNEKVLAPRLEDAKFFFEEDLKTGLEDKVPALKKVTFHEKLGSLYDKTLRLEALCERLGKELAVGKETIANLKRSAYLSKADLTTNMVTEFPELEGTMGRIYAEEDGENPIVAKAIEEQYAPRGASGELPKMTSGRILSIADKLDSICGLMSIGIKTTGSQDPFGLRRNALGIIRILLDSKMEIDLKTMIHDSLYIYLQSEEMVIDYKKMEQEILGYFTGRLENLLEAEGYRYDVVNAVLAIRPEAVYDSYQRVRVLTDIVNNPEYEETLTTLGRMTNFAEKAETTEINRDLLETEDEKALADFEEEKAELDVLLDRGDYKEAMELVRTMMPAVNIYLDNTMVNVEDEALRNNRMALIADIYEKVLRFFDVDKIVKG